MSYIEFARWFGLVSILLSLGILFNLENARAMAKKMVDEESGYIMGGVLPIIFGTYAVVLNHAFEISWQLVVTIIGLFMVLIGCYRVMFIANWKKLMTMHIDKIAPLFSLFGLILGLLLLYVGFISHVVEYEIALLSL